MEYEEPNEFAEAWYDLLLEWLETPIYTDENTLFAEDFE